MYPGTGIGTLPVIFTEPSPASSTDRDATARDRTLLTHRKPQKHLQRTDEKIECGVIVI